MMVPTSTTVALRSKTTFAGAAACALLPSGGSIRIHPRAMNRLGMGHPTARIFTHIIIITQ